MTLAGLGADLARIVDLRRFVIAVVAITALITLPGVIINDTFVLGAGLSLPSAFGAVLLLGAALLSTAWARAGREGPSTWAPGALFVALAIDEAFAFHEDVALAPAVIAGAIAVAVLAWLALAPRLASTGQGRVPFVLAALTWGLGAMLSGVVAEGPEAVRVVGELLEIAGACMVVVALVIAVRAATAPAASDGEHRPTAQALAGRLALAADVRTLVIAAVLVIASFAVMGTIVIAGADWRVVDLGDERTLPAYFSSLLLWTGAGLAVLVSSYAETPRERLLWRCWAVTLIMGAITEISEIHERFQFEVGATALLALSPLVAFGAVTAVRLLLSTWRDQADRRAMIAGGAAWALALAVDVAHGPDGTNLDYLIVVEEAFEMTGSALFLLSVLGVARRTLRAGAPGAETARAAVL